MKCINCDKEINASSKFCPECGASNKVVCKKCNRENPVNTNFCMGCGSPLNSDENKKSEVNIKSENDTINENNSDNENNIVNESNTINKTNTINESNHVNENKTIVENYEDKKVGDRLGIISLLLYFASGIVELLSFGIFPNEFGMFLSSIVGMCPLAGIVVMIVGRVKYPKNKLLKITMWVIIGTLIASVVLLIIFLAFCFITCKSIGTEGCS